MLLIELFNPFALLEARLDFIRTKYLPLLKAAVEKNAISIPDPLHNLIGGNSDETAARVLDYVVSCDPDPQQKNLQWLLNLLLKGGFLLEDGSKAVEYLKLFAQVKPRLPQESRDLNKVKSLSDLFTVIEPYRDAEPEQSKRQVANTLDQEMHQEAKVVMNTAEYKILIPLTQRASCYFGINTQWCTAATRSHNYFEHYNNQGPLYIILDKKNNTRWQFQPASNSYMDANDRPIHRGVFAEQHPKVAQFFTDMDGQPVGSLKTRAGELQVYPNGRGGFFLKEKPGMLANPVMKIAVTDGLLSNVTDENGSPLGGSVNRLAVRPGQFAALLNHLKINGDPNGAPSASTCDLVYREGSWGSIYEKAKPSISLGGGWHWSSLAVKNPQVSYTTWLLMAPGTTGTALAGAFPEADHVYLEAGVYGDGSFHVDNILGEHHKPKFQADEHVSGAILKLIQQNPEISKWQKDSALTSDQLSEQAAKTLLDQRPELCNVGTVFKVQGLSDLVKKKISDDLDEADVEHTGEWVSNKMIVKIWDDLSDCVGDIGNDHMKWLDKLAGGEDSIEVYDTPEPDDGDIRRLLDDLSPEEKQKLVAWVEDNYAAEIETYRDEEDEGFDPNDMRDLADFAKRYVDEIQNAAREAHISGAQIGAENEAMKAYREAFRDAPILFQTPDGWTKDFTFDAKIALVIPAATIINAIDREDLDDTQYNGWAGYLDIKLDPDEPRSGYNDFDDEAANERFKEELPV